MRVLASWGAPLCVCQKIKNMKTSRRDWTLHRGSDFIHGGDSYGGAPAYIPPEVLLAEPTVDRMVPLNNPIPYGQ